MRSQAQGTREHGTRNRPKSNRRQAKGQHRVVTWLTAPHPQGRIGAEEGGVGGLEGGGSEGGGGLTLLLDNCSMKDFGHRKQWMNGNAAKP